MLLKKSCPNDNFKDGTCSTCKNNNFTDNTCSKCKNDNFTDNTCSKCKNDNFKDNTCSTCINDNFKDATCKTCKNDNFKDDGTCSTCINDNFKDDGTCSECKDGFKGTKCNLKETVCDKNTPCAPEPGKQVTTFRPGITDILDERLYDEVADYLTENNHKSWFQYMTPDALKTYGGRVYDDTDLEIKYLNSPWTLYELVD